MHTWNRERIRTRDRLIDQDYIIPPETEDVDEAIVYPQLDIPLPLLQRQLLALATANGFQGNSEALWTQLLNSEITLSHSLKFGANQEFVFDGSQDITIPVYTGAII